MNVITISLFSQVSECSTSGENATIIFGQGIVPKLNNNPIPNGTIIRAMYQTPSGLKCGGYMEWNGEPNTIAAFGAEGTNEGFKQQEVFKYSIKLPDGTEITNDKITVNYKSPDGILCLNNDKYVTNGISCIGSFSATKISATNDYDNLKHVNIFPNPSKNIFTIESKYKVIEVKVYNNTGHFIKSKINSNMNLDLSEESPGIYILHIFTEKGESQHKIIKTD